jgi:hypothetical protein
MSTVYHRMFKFVNSLSNQILPLVLLIYDSLGKRQKGAVLLDSVDLVQARNCQPDLTHALGWQERYLFENSQALLMAT